MRLGWGSPATARRLARTGHLVAVVAFLAAAVAAMGALLLGRGAELRSVLPAEVRYYAVVRSALADAAADGLAAVPGVLVVAKRSLSDLLPPSETRGVIPDRLRVVELAVGAPPIAGERELTEAAIRKVDGVVDLIQLNATARTPPVAEGAGRWIAAGALLLGLGCVGFTFGVARACSAAAESSREELVTRVLLGADPVRLWLPLGTALGIAGSVGALLGVAVITLVARGLVDPAVASTVSGGDVPPGGITLIVVLSGIGLVVGACALAMMATKLAVERVALRSASEPRRRVAEVVAVPRAAAALTLFLLAAAPAAARANEDELAPLDLGLLVRELAVARRALHQAEIDLVGAEYRVFRAAASGDDVQLRLTAAELDVSAQQVLRWRASRDSLIALRAELRSLRAAERAPEWSIGPRIRPVRGIAAGGFDSRGEAGPKGFRRGIALRTRPGETVRATAHGRVAFAGELAGAGSVVVLSHGRRTYSVYGRVAEVLIARGMEVEPGEAIAVAPDQPGLLYFAIRERGRAVDPERWLDVGGH